MINPLDMTGKTLLVTGASSGIGRATAILLSQLGARVILVARSRERLEETQRQLAGGGHSIEIFDLGAYEDIPTWLRDLAANYGLLDGMVHSAGLDNRLPLKMINAAQTETLWRINVSASLWLAKGYRQRCVNNRGGSVVFLSSAAGLVGQPAQSVYAASKGGVIALTRSLAMELAREQIRVNCIAPGMVKGEMFQELTKDLTEEHRAAIERDHPLGFGEPIDVANAAAFLLSPASRWITGTTLVADGGYTAH